MMRSVVVCCEGIESIDFDRVVLIPDAIHDISMESHEFKIKIRGRIQHVEEF